MAVARSGRGADCQPFFTDFACRELKIIVEVDRGTHGTDEKQKRDEARSAYMEAQGFRIFFRAHNLEVDENIDGVLETLLAFIRGEVS